MERFIGEISSFLGKFNRTVKMVVVKISSEEDVFGGKGTGLRESIFLGEVVFSTESRSRSQHFHLKVKEISEFEVLCVHLETIAIGWCII